MQCNAMTWFLGLRRLMVHFLAEPRKGSRTTWMPLTTASCNLDQRSQLSPPMAVWMLSMTGDKNNLRYEGGRKTCIWKKSTSVSALLALFVGPDSPTRLCEGALIPSRRWDTSEVRWKALWSAKFETEIMVSPSHSLDPTGHSLLFRHQSPWSTDEGKSN